ncbi:MAG: hypothetical protein ACP5HM_00830 [Anaerolineae bacterium]
MNAFKIIWKSLRVYYSELFPLVLMGLATVAATFLVIPAPFALAGLWYVTRRSVEGRSTKWYDFWEGVKRYGPRNLLNALLALFGYLVIATNIWFYNNPAVSPLPDQAALWLTALWLMLILLWTAVNFYWLAFQMEMEEPRFWLSLRNSLFLTLLNPIQSLVFLLVAALLAALAIVVPPLIILFPAFIATLSTTAVKTMLAPILERQKELEEAAVEDEN